MKSLTILIGLFLHLTVSFVAQAGTTDSELTLAQAQFQKGSQYYYGRGVEKNLDQALFWYLKSAEKGHAKSELAVAQVLAFGDRKKPRYQDALPWLIKAQGPHTSPQISGMEKAEASATKNLKWLCRKGLVDFPKDHALAKDPNCWLKRGDRLFHGSSSLNYYLKKDKKKYYGVIKKDYVASRHYLEKAFFAGKTEAAIHLAEIYKKGLDVQPDSEKFDYFTKQAAEEGHGKSNYYLAEQALEAGDNHDYVEKLNSAAAGDSWEASQKLAWAYFYGDGVNQDYERAFMYFFLREQSTFVRERDPRHGDTRLPFFKNKFLSVFQTEISLETLEHAYRQAVDFAEDHNFRQSKFEKIERSYNIAVSDFHYVKETGGEWYKSDLLSKLSIYFLFFIMVLTIRTVTSGLINRK
ncbi:tetratricopeptide repeat protein [Litorimonas sp. WD9-15]|uniref:tetratricopeptide repeat protein n=1 Tax=Litorimonas sp. WD9-15 TaxID=3418716 RepID=UPI003D01EC76